MRYGFFLFCFFISPSAQGDFGGLSYLATSHYPNSAQTAAAPRAGRFVSLPPPQPDCAGRSHQPGDDVVDDAAAVAWAAEAVLRHGQARLLLVPRQMDDPRRPNSSHASYAPCSLLPRGCIRLEALWMVRMPPRRNCCHDRLRRYSHVRDPRYYRHPH